MEAIDLVAREHVDVALHEVRAEEVPSDVEVHAAVGETGSVVDPYGPNLERRRSQPGTAPPPGTVSQPRGQELRQRLQAVKEARVITRGNRDARLGHSESVALRTSASVDTDAERTVVGEG